MGHPYSTTSDTPVEGAEMSQKEWLDSNGDAVYTQQQGIEEAIEKYNQAVASYNSAATSAKLGSVSAQAASGDSFVQVMNTYYSVSGVPTDEDIDEAQKYIDNLGEDKEQTKDDLEDLLETIKDEAEAIAEASAEMADLLDDLLDKTEGEGDLPEDDSDEIQDANDDAEDADAEAAKENVEDPRIEAALKKADYPKGTFSEQCYLLSRIFSLVKHKHQQLDVDKWTATGMSKPLPYYTDPNYNASLSINGDAYGFMNQLVQHPAQSAFFDMKTEQISTLQPMIRLYKVTLKDNEEVQQEYMFDSYATKTDVENLLTNKAKRGFGVGIKNFSFTYDGNNPFAAKKSIKAQLTIFASSFDDLLIERGDPQNPYKYAELALKTGKGSANVTAPDSETSEACQERAQAMRNNLEAMSFRLKAVVGWARPTGNTTLLATSDSEQVSLLDAIGESHVTLNLIPTVHEFKIDEMGRVNFTCNYLAFVEDFFDQQQFDVFFNAEAAQNILKRKYEYEALSKDCDPSTVGEWKKSLAASGAIPQDKYLNLQSLMNRMVAASKIRNLNISYNEAMTSTITGPFQVEESGGLTESQLQGGTASEEDIASALAIGNTQLTTDVTDSASTDTDIQEETPVNTAQNVSFFYVSDLFDEILKGIDERLYLFTNRQTWEDMGLDETEIEEEVTKYEDFKREYKKFRLLLGPIEIVNSQDNSESRFVSLGDIPISAKFFMSWLSETMVKKDQAIYNLGGFANDFFNTLLNDFLNNDTCFKGFSIKQKTRLSQAAVTSYKTSDQDYDEITEWMIHNNASTPANFAELQEGTPAGGWPKIGEMNHPVLNVSGPQELPVSDGGAENEINYLIFFAGRHQPQDKMQGSRQEDEAQGVFHYLLGRPRGIVKTISLSRTDAKYLKEVRFEQEGFQGLEQLREVYDANIECYANVKTFPGTYIFIDPRSFAPNPITYGAETMDLTMFGIGGYYMIIRSEHNFGPGTANTKLTAKWVAQIHPEEEEGCETPHRPSSGDGSTTKCNDQGAGT